MSNSPRVLIVAEHASAQFGGEAVLPLHYFQLLRERDVDVWMVVHERTKFELQNTLSAVDFNRLYFVKDTMTHGVLWRMHKYFPRKIYEITIGLLLRLLTQYMARRMAMLVIKSNCIDVVHQPIPVSPKEPSLLWNIGVPVVMGPMNGGMTYPPSFLNKESGVHRMIFALAREASHVINFLLRGKREASTLLVANERTRQALPRGTRGRIVLLVENAVDRRLFTAEPHRPRTRQATDPLRAVFVGRLIDWKALDIALDAIAEAYPKGRIYLDVIGDGPMRNEWELYSRHLGISQYVTYHGFVPQRSVPKYLARADVLVLPSLYECGGAVVLEAMAMAMPVVATGWGGPLDYIENKVTGFLVAPDSRASMVRDFSSALICLANKPGLAEEIGMRAQIVVSERFDWHQKVQQIVDIYADAIERYRP